MKKLCEESGLGFCPVETSIEMLSGKWKGRILWKLYYYGTMRFGELRRSLEPVTEKMLSQQLRELETCGLVKRNIYREVPPKVEYSMTSFGQSLGPLLDQFAQWGLANKAKIKKVTDPVMTRI